MLDGSSTMGNHELCHVEGEPHLHFYINPYLGTRVVEMMVKRGDDLLPFGHVRMDRADNLICQRLGMRQ